MARVVITNTLSASNLNKILQKLANEFSKKKKHILKKNDSASPSHRVGETSLLAQIIRKVRKELRGGFLN